MAAAKVRKKQKPKLTIMIAVVDQGQTQAVMKCMMGKNRKNNQLIILDSRLQSQVLIQMWQVLVAWLKKINTFCIAYLTVFLLLHVDIIWPLKTLGESVIDIPKYAKQNTLLLSPSTLKNCSIQIDLPILIPYNFLTHSLNQCNPLDT